MLNAKMQLQCLIVVLCLNAAAMAGKYSREVNEPKPGSSDGVTVEFRIGKLNQVWEKAKRVSTMSYFAIDADVTLVAVFL